MLTIDRDGQEPRADVGQNERTKATSTVFWDLAVRDPVSLCTAKGSSQALLFVELAARVWKATINYMVPQLLLVTFLEGCIYPAYEYIE